MITVIIPFFQRESGLLSRTVRSVLDQDVDRITHIVITDDGSPIRAHDELGAAVLDDSRVTLVEQGNAGPGAARNKCLDSLPAATRYVALMDSDDCWQPGFLNRAKPALSLGVDLYFCDSRRHGQSESRFHWDEDETLNLRAEHHEPLQGAESLFRFTEPFLDFMLRRSNILGPSSTIYRLACAPHLRFDPSLYNGQDRLFKLKLARYIRTACFCDEVLCLEGAGINIFDSAIWGTQKALRLAASYINLNKKILRELDLTPSQAEFIRTRLKAARRDFSANALNLVQKGSEMDWTLFRQTVASDPAIMAMVPRQLAMNVTRSLRGRQD